ncbi:MAG: DUF2628 domain-containing protein [Cetobacterium sp.]|uniref:DUF2628 domain-containing protein n=1 Tax=unclassified Cetobacterium TaxID=2630983 RepID=UPI000647FC20|nr:MULTISPECIES: DUF2628 domain-containing protein [unclassified Cetobacterium]
MESRIDYVDKHLGSLEDFVRGSSKYYLETWRSDKIKFNFAAFLFEALWFAYRKMYDWAFVLLTINISINLLTFLVLIKTKFYMGGMLLTLVIRIFLGFKANDIYYNRAKKILEKCEFEPEDKDCGTSLLGVSLIVFLGIIFQVLLDFYLGITLYYQS